MAPDSGSDAASSFIPGADGSYPAIIDGSFVAPSADTGTSDAASGPQDTGVAVSADAYPAQGDAKIDPGMADARPPEAGAPDAAPCTCSANDACCDGCRTKNESGACASDGLDCTDDLCRSGSCRHERKSGYCLIGTSCFADGAPHPSNKCQACNAVSVPSAWSNRTRGATCDDSVYCNGADSCDGVGSCTLHAGDPCGTDPCWKCNEAARSCPLSTTATFYDSTTNFLWDLTGEDAYNWQVAIDRCEALTLCGHSDWRLPSITELRSAVRGCPSTQAGGACMVSTSCLQSSCSSSCVACTFEGGPSSTRAYWPFDFPGNSGTTWSSSTLADDTSKAWTIYFISGAVSYANKVSDGPANAGNARCVRTGRP